MSRINLKAYYQLTKPGIIRGNAITASAGFFLAARGNVDIWLFLAMLGGISLIIASGCVFNNYIDRDIDKKMKRTKNRSLATGQLSGRSALVYASTLGIIGTALLAVYTNTLTLLVALFGFFAYVIVYGIAKRKSVHGTVVGSVSGAVPPVVGYLAVTNNFDPAALLLFLILVAWQMPHFYAIALYRQKEYEAANIPVLPIVKGHSATKKQILYYIIVFSFFVFSLTYFKYTGIIYTLAMAVACFMWIRIAIKDYKSAQVDAWARKLFGFSLLVLLIFSTMISLEAWLP